MNAPAVGSPPDERFRLLSGAEAPQARAIGGAVGGFCAVYEYLRACAPENVTVREPGAGSRGTGVALLIA
jgi:hypothetical protein